MSGLGIDPPGLDEADRAQQRRRQIRLAFGLGDGGDTQGGIGVIRGGGMRRAPRRQQGEQNTKAPGRACRQPDVRTATLGRSMLRHAPE